MSLQTRQTVKRNAQTYILDPLDPQHPDSHNTPMAPYNPENPGNPANPNQPNNPANPTGEIREPQQPQAKYKFDPANRDPRFYAEMMQLMEFGQNELYTRY